MNNKQCFSELFNFTLVILKRLLRRTCSDSMWARAKWIFFLALDEWMSWSSKWRNWRGLDNAPPQWSCPLLQIDHEISVISKHSWGKKGRRYEGIIKSNQIIIIQKCGANCVYRFFRTVQLTFALCAATLAEQRWRQRRRQRRRRRQRAIEQLSMRANIVARSTKAALPSSIATRQRLRRVCVCVWDCLTRSTAIFV